MLRRLKMAEKKKKQWVQLYSVRKGNNHCGAGYYTEIEV